MIVTSFVHLLRSLTIDTPDISSLAMMAVEFLSASYDGLMVNYSRSLNCPGWSCQDFVDTRH